MSWLRCQAWRSLLRTWSRTIVDRSFSRRYSSIDSKYIQVSEEVQQAISESRPVVALESTIYTHGFPFPENVALASSLETVVRSGNAVPATIGVLNGIAKIGLSSNELVRLASCSQQPEDLLKVSRRDLAFALSASTPRGERYCGGTTVAGTMILAHLAGIKIFATGGLGGVHRGADATFDISADLTELGRTPVAVIAAGCKAFLDIPKTLEYLETQGCGIATFADGRTGSVDFPGFWSRNSGSQSPMTIRSEHEAARMIYAQHALGLQSGLLFGNPISENHEIPLAEMQHAIDQALLEARNQGASGNRATPFILAKIKELTGSRSVEANTILVENNVRRGVGIAIELSKLEKENEYSQSKTQHQAFSRVNSLLPDTGSIAQSGPDSGVDVKTQPNESESQDIDVFVAGMLAVDFACDYDPSKHSPNRPLEMHTSNPARITQSLGGVGHNVARAAQLSGANTALGSVVAQDMNGKAALNALAREGLSSDLIVISSSEGKRTAQYVAVNNSGKDLVVAMADMNILDYDQSDPLADAFNDKWLPQLRQHRPSHVVVDGNWPPIYLHRWIEAAKAINAMVIFEPVSSVKSTAIFQASHSSKQAGSTARLAPLGVFPTPSIDLATPNEQELSSMYNAAREQGLFERADWWQVIDAFGIPSSGARTKMALATSNELVDRGVPQQSVQLLPYMPCITTKLGAQGVLLTQILGKEDPRLLSSSHAPYILSRTNIDDNQSGVGGVYMRLFPPSEIVAAEEIVSVNGVGDTFVGVLVAGLAKQKKEGSQQRVEDLIDVAQRASVLTLKSKEAVSPKLGVLSVLL